MKKTLFVIGTICLCMLSSLIIPHTSFAEKNLEDIQKERKDIKENLSATEKEVTTILTEIKEMNEEIEEYNATLKANKKAIKEVEKEIESVEDEIDALEKKIEERFEILKERAQSYQTNGGDVGYLEVILGAKDFNEFISRLTAITKITDADAELIKEQEKDKEKVEKKLEELEGLKKELKVIEANIVEQKEISLHKKETLEEKQTELKDKVAKLEIKDEELASLEDKILGEMAAPISGGTSFAVQTVDGGGALGWPTKGGYISSHMGERWGKMHKGIDIARTDRSTSPPIFAADDGTVETAGFNNGGYGNLVIINHGNGLKTLYAHMSSINVRSGQTVSRGQQIGVMGETGDSQGIHLHFEVHLNGALQNPVSYLR